jgi:Na+/proline symporter
MLEPSLKTDTIFPLFIMQNLPVGVVGLVIAGVFAASMSTLDSSINSVSMVIVRDFYQRLKGNGDDRTALRLGKVLTVVLGGFATVMAVIMSVSDVSSVWELFIMLSGLILSSVGGFFLLGIFTRRASLIPAFIGAAFGTAVVLLLKFQTGTSFFIYQGCGITTTFVVGYLVSRFVANPINVSGLTVYDLPARTD